MSQSRACFEAAIHVLVGDGPIKPRLKRAYELHLEHLQETDLPSDLRESFVDLDTALHRVRPMGEQSCIRSTIQKMSAAEATAHAETIVRLYTDLLALGERTEPLKVVETQPALAPRFLIGTT